MHRKNDNTKNISKINSNPIPIPSSPSMNITLNNSTSNRSNNYIRGLLGGSEAALRGQPKKSSSRNMTYSPRLDNAASIEDTSTDNSSSSSDENDEGSNSSLSPDNGSLRLSAENKPGNFEISEEKFFTNESIAPILRKLKSQLSSDPQINLNQFYESAARTLAHVIHEDIKFLTFKKTIHSDKTNHVMYYPNFLKRNTSMSMLRKLTKLPVINQTNECALSTEVLEFANDHSGHYNSSDPDYINQKNALPVSLKSYDNQTSIDLADTSNTRLDIPVCVGYKTESLKPQDLILKLNEFFKRDPHNTSTVNIILGDFDDITKEYKEFSKEENAISEFEQKKWKDNWEKACEDYFIKNPHESFNRSRVGGNFVELEINATGELSKPICVKAKLAKQSIKPQVFIYTHKGWMDLDMNRIIAKSYIKYVLPQYAKETVNTAVAFVKAKSKKMQKNEKSDFLKSPMQTKSPSALRSPNLMAASAPEPAKIDPMYEIIYLKALHAYEKGDNEKLNTNWALANHYTEFKSNLSVSTSNNNLFNERNRSPNSARNNSAGNNINSNARPSLPNIPRTKI